MTTTTNTTGSDAQLFDEVFYISNIDQKKYDRVARMAANNEERTVNMTLDFNTDLYPCAVGDKLHMVLSTSLSLDGSKDDQRGWRDVGHGKEPTLADMYDYVTYGKIYDFEDGASDETIKCYVSFGGLLMQLEGPYKKLTPLRVAYIYCLIKK